MKITVYFLLSALLLLNPALSAQVGINSDGSSPDPSAMLDIKSSETGFLPPRLSNAQIGVIPSPAEGLMVYSTTEKRHIVFDRSGWMNLDGRRRSNVFQHSHFEI
jgi:hypothetical protein